LTISSTAPERAAPPPQTDLHRAAFFGLDTLIPGSSLYLLAQGLQRRHFYGRGDLLAFAGRRLALRARPSHPPHVRGSQDAQPEVQRQLQPARGKDQGRQGAEVFR
jgi:hypothetical protein